MNKYTLTIKGADPMLAGQSRWLQECDMLAKEEYVSSEYRLDWLTETEWTNYTVQSVLNKMKRAGWRIDSHLFTETLEIK